jgi:hypothetical protein
MADPTEIRPAEPFCQNKPGPGPRGRKEKTSSRLTGMLANFIICYSRDDEGRVKAYLAQSGYGAQVRRRQVLAQWFSDQVEEFCFEEYMRRIRTYSSKHIRLI